MMCFVEDENRVFRRRQDNPAPQREIREHEVVVRDDDIGVVDAGAR